MPVITVNDQQYSLRPGANRLGGGADVDLPIGDDPSLGLQAIVEYTTGTNAVIRRASDRASVRVNGVPLVDPTPLMHGDKMEIAGRELFFADDAKVGATQFVTADAVIAMAQKRAGAARATAATGGRLVSLVDGKEYEIPTTGVVIGRDPTADVVVAQNEVSRRHAEVAPGEHGYVLRDLSANGVYLNGTRIDQSCVLSRADVIRVGSEEFRFYADVAPAAARPAAAAPASPPVPAAPPAVPPVAGQATPASVPAAVPHRDPRPVLAMLEIVNEGPTKGTTFEIRDKLSHVGRGAHNDVAISDDSVSESHAKLQRREAGWFVVDLGSTNGTYVSGTRVTAEQALEPGGTLRVGGVKLRFLPVDLDTGEAKGTRMIGAIQRPVAPESAARPATLNAVGTPAGNVPTRRGISRWVWIAAVVAIAAAATYFLLNR